jgi:hypothetical protein
MRMHSVVLAISTMLCGFGVGVLANARGLSSVAAPLVTLSPGVGSVQQAPAAQEPSVATARRFSSDSGIIFNIVKPDKTGEFEAVMLKVKEGLAQSKDQKQKQMALNWRVFKGLETGVGGNVVYVFWFDPPVHDVDYAVTPILTGAFPNDAQDIWSKFVGSFASPPTMLNLHEVVNMSPNSMPKGK